MNIPITKLADTLVQPQELSDGTKLKCLYENKLSSRRVKVYMKAGRRSCGVMANVASLIGSTDTAISWLRGKFDRRNLLPMCLLMEK
jgi:hypothetical protein